MCFPHTFDTDDPNNIWMQQLSQEEIDEDFQKAYSQWDLLYDHLSGAGTVYLLPPAGDYPDQVYVANVVVILCHKPKPIAVVANFQSPPRKGEEKVAYEFFGMMGYPVYRPPTTWEGEAEIKHLRDNIYVGGYGIRTDPKSYDWFEQKFDMKIVRVKMTDPHLYHFDCMFFPLTAEKAMVCTSLMEKSDVDKIEKVCEIIPVSAQLAHAGATNCVRTVNLLFCASSMHSLEKGSYDWEKELDKETFLTKVCAKNGLELVLWNGSEFEKSGAALSCLVAHINRQAYSQPIV
jgi:N-dimethylarginine dimethylaminohydrolase